ncbi:MAG: DUF2568 domain-containing protein [Streptomyces sp.]|nr:DUF2568 domain-containing protein [Streptomyces sp.]
MPGRQRQHLFAGSWSGRTGRTAHGLRYVAVVGIPVLVAVVWGVFATPDDASRSGDTVVATAGPLRLLLELAVFFGGAAAAYAAGAQNSALLLMIVLVAYHAASLDRIGWLLRN